MTRSARPAARTRARRSACCSREIVVVVTRQPRCAAAWTAKPPQPVPISSTWSSGPRSSLSQIEVELGDRRLLERHRLGAAKNGARVHHRRVEHQRRTARCRGRSARRCPGGCARGVLRADAARALERLAQRREPRGAHVERAGVARGDADHATRSGQSHRPSAYDSASPRLPAQQRRARRVGERDVHARRLAPRAELVAVRALDDREAAVADARRGTRRATMRARRSSALPGGGTGALELQRAARGRRSARERGRSAAASDGAASARGRRRSASVASNARLARLGGSRCAPTASARARSRASV